MHGKPIKARVAKRIGVAALTVGGIGLVGLLKYSWAGNPLHFWIGAGLVTVPTLVYVIVRKPRIRFPTALLLIGAAANLTVLFANGGRMPVALKVLPENTVDLGIHWQAADNPRLPLLIDRLPGGFSAGDIAVMAGAMLMPFFAATDRRRALFLTAAGLAAGIVTLMGAVFVNAIIQARVGSLLPDAARLTYAAFAGLMWLFACVGVVATYQRVRRTWPYKLREGAKK